MQLYKYYSYRNPNDNNLMIEFIENGEFLFNQLNYFNDKYEGNWIGLNKERSIDQLEKERDEIRRNIADFRELVDTSIIEDLCTEIGGITFNPIDFPGMFNQESISYDQQTNRRRINDKISQIGVMCLSKTNTNQLMWCHYSDSEKGICIGFDVEHYFFKNCIMPITYSRKRPNIY